MIKKTILALAFALICAICYGDALRDVSEASCRVTAGSASGSGTSVYVDETYLYVITNAHVVGNSRTATVEFWKYGQKTLPIRGNIIWRVKKVVKPTLQ